jgi:hypothetical protein
MGNFEGARKCYEWSLEIVRDTFGEEHPNEKIILGNLESIKAKK